MRVSGVRVRSSGTPKSGGHRSVARLSPPASAACWPQPGSARDARAMAAGYTIKELMEHMGHADLQMVNRYVKLLPSPARTRKRVLKVRTSEPLEMFALASRTSGGRDSDESSGTDRGSRRRERI